MAGPKIFHGARAIVSVGTQVAGTFSSFSYSVSQDVQPAFILGSFTAAELTTTAQEPVSCSATGWRVVGNGPYQQAGMTRVQDLLTQPYTTITVLDRQTGNVVAKIRSVKTASFSSTISTKAQTEVSYSFIGIMMDDETVDIAETQGAATLP